MSIRQVTMYQVVCDSCGINAHEKGDYSAWGDEDGARIEAEASDWERISEQDFCPDCYHFCDGQPSGNPAPGEFKDCEVCQVGVEGIAP